MNQWAARNPEAYEAGGDEALRESFTDRVDGRAHARRTDPETSHAAARSVTDLTAKQTAVLTLLRDFGPLTDLELVEKYGTAAQGFPGVFPRQSTSGLRTRRHELVDRGLVVEHDKVRLPSGRMAIRWKVAENGGQLELV